jgi:flagellar biosynthetic protein FlhB
MADSKPFEPTPTWIAKAKRQGNIARSQELCGICSLLLGTLAIAAFVPVFGAVARDWIARTATDAGLHVEAALPLTAIAIAVLLFAGAGGVTASILQERPFFIFPKFKAERLNPKEGLGRMFSREAAVSAARAVLVLALAAAALVPTARDVFARGAAVSPLIFLVSLAMSSAGRIVFAVLVVGGAFAIFDVILVRRRWRKKLRMNAYELKRDMRESEGDPRQKFKRRSMHRTIGRGSLGSVRKAAFVVTNPTHIAIALEYRPPDVAVPRVLVRAADETAGRVRELAAVHGIPLVENVSLARELYALTQPGEEIPIETYVAVAEIVNALAKRGVPA